MGIVKRNSITITILSYLGIVVGYVNKILLFPNFLSEEQVGLANILVSMAVMYAQFSAMGINSTIVKFFPFFRTPDRRHNGFFFWTALGVSLGFVLFTTLFLIFREPVTEYYAQKSPLLSKYYLLLIPLGFTTLFFNFFTAWLQALYKTVVSSFVYEVALRLLVTAEISLYALGAIDFEQFIVGYVLIYFVPTLVLLVYTLWTRRIDLRPVWTGRTRRLLSVAAVYGLWQYLGGTSMYIVPVIDQSMLAGMRGLAQQAVYSTMAYMVAAMLTPYRSMIKVATPVVTNLWKERDMEGMRRISREMSLVNLIVGSFLFLLIWVNLDNIFSLMPGSYSDGRYVFLFLGLARDGHVLGPQRHDPRHVEEIPLRLHVLADARRADGRVERAADPALGHDGRGACHDDHRAGLQRDPDRIGLEILPHPAVRALRSARRRAGGRMYRRVGPRSADGALHRRRSDPQRAGRRAVRAERSIR